MSQTTAKNLALAGQSGSIDEVMAHLRNKDDDVSLVDLMTTAEHLVGSMQTIFGALDTSILREFGQIASSITKARDEIGRLQPQDITEEHIPEAGRELQAIISATEDATHTIMEAAENLLELEVTDIDTYKTAVEGEVMRIFEACSFQDITGQRVSKVVEALQDIDERVSRISAAFGSELVAVEKSERETTRDNRKRDQILNGPALDGEGIDQGDIDKLLTEDQSSIDALFD
ncbi:COG3143: Chemotaxis protein [hydrothermal vent metagenome]|uniref:COG3143: Chemotaxis protein n=1 Tax=hydrothermal vent metagenome TaxID=652676 RepID=A0A3B0TG38_9ZZZZ